MKQEVIGLCMHMLRVGNRLDQIRMLHRDGQYPEEYYECGLKLLKLDYRLRKIVEMKRSNRCLLTLNNGEVLVDRKDEGWCSLQCYRMEHVVEYDLLRYVAYVLRVELGVDFVIGVRLSSLYGVYPAKSSSTMNEFKSMVKNNRLAASNSNPHNNLMFKGGFTRWIQSS